LLVGEDFEQARVLIALLSSIVFFGLHIAVKPLKRADDGALMMFVELALIFVYMCVLLIKTCDMSSVGASANLVDRDAAARAVCRTFGFGETADGLYGLFLVSGLTLLLLVLLSAITRVGIEGVLPRMLLLTRAHSLSTTTLLAKVVNRKSANLKRGISRAFGLDGLRLNPHAASLVYKYRASHGRLSPPDTPLLVQPLATGSICSLFIQAVFPRTKCYVQIDMRTLSIRWTDEHAVSLVAVEKVEMTARMRRRKTLDLLPSNFIASRWLRKASEESIRVSDRISKLSGRGSKGASRKGTIPEKVKTEIMAAVAITFTDCGGVERVLFVLMPRITAQKWVEGLQELLTIIPRTASPVHWRWSLSCMAATSKRSTSGFFATR